MAGEYPSLEDVYARVDAFVADHPDLARCEDLGRSPEGREVRAVYVSDPTTSDRDKSVALIVCGRHGNEAGTRVVGTALLDWLASPTGNATRRRQIVIVVPVANPDGAAHGAFHAPPWHLSQTEYATIGELASTHLPDAVMDVHSFGEDDADLQAVVTGNTTSEAEDEAIHRSVAARMVEAAARAGYPYALHTEKRKEGYNNFISGYCYDLCHSLAFGMEVNHHVLEPEEAAESGVAAITALLAEGNERLPWQVGIGYPNELLRGDFFTSIRPAGQDAAKRRQSRACVWQDRMFYRLGRREAPSRRTVTMRAMYTGYADRVRPSAFALCCRVRGRHDSLEVILNGKVVEAVTFGDECSTYAQVDVQPTGREDYELTVRF